MSRAEARQLALELVRKCDLVMENFTPRVMDGWGLGYRDLKLIKPDIVMVSLSGFGRSGPWRNYAALGPTVQALSGLTQLTSYHDGRPDGIGFAYADHISGLYAALAALAALRRRDKPRGRAHTSRFQSLRPPAACLAQPCWTIRSTAARLNPRVTGLNGGRLPRTAATAAKGDDRWCVIAVFSDEEWQSLCNVMGQPQLGAAG